MIDLARQGDVFVLRFAAPENRFRPESVAAWNAALDRVEQAGNPAALVTPGTGKFYSNGLDLEWLLSTATESERKAYIPSVLALMARMLSFPAITSRRDQRPRLRRGRPALSGPRLPHHADRARLLVHARDRPEGASPLRHDGLDPGPRPETDGPRVDRDGDALGRRGGARSALAGNGLDSNRGTALVGRAGFRAPAAITELDAAQDLREGQLRHGESSE